MTDLELYEDHQIRRALAQIKAAPMTVGDAWKVGGTIDWGAVALSVNTAAELGLAPRTNYKFFPVIKGQVYPMAEICRVLLFRHGGDLTVTCDTAQQCTVVVTGPNGKTFPPFTVTAQEATAAGWGKPSGLATSDIRSILRARASMRAIKLNCPQVLAGPPPERWGDWHNEPGPEVDGAEPSSGPAPLAASTRQEAVSGTTAQKLRDTLGRLTAGQRHSVADLWRREQLPAIDALDLDGYTTAIGLVLDVIADDTAPPDLYEAEPDPDRETDADNYRYSPHEDDPGRPFV